MANTHSLDLESGSSQYASISDASQTGLDLSGDFTLEGWFKFESTPGSNTMMPLITKYATSSSNRSFQFGLYNDAGTLKIQGQVYNSSSQQDVVRWNWTPTTGVWYHLALAFDISQATASEFEFFIDGSTQGNGSVVVNTNISDIKNSTVEFAVGMAREGADLFDGLIDEVRVWNDIRTSTEISDNKDTELVGNESGLVGYWKFNNAYTDETSNSNDLTASGSPVFSTDVPFSGAISVTVEPSVQALTASQSAATVTSATNVTISQSALMLTSSQPVASVSAIQNTSQSLEVQELTATQPSATILTGTVATITPGTQSLSLSQVTPTISTVVQVSVAADVQALTTSQPSLVASTTGGVLIEPSAQTVAASLPTPNTFFDKTVSASSLTLGLSQPAAEVEFPDQWIFKSKTDSSNDWTNMTKISN